METDKMNFPQVREALAEIIFKLKGFNQQIPKDIDELSSLEDKMYFKGVESVVKPLLSIIEKDGNPELAEDRGLFKNLNIQEEIQLPRASAETLWETPKFINELEKRTQDNFLKSLEEFIYEGNKYKSNKYGEEKVQTTNN